MSESLILTESLRPEVIQLTLNRPERRNALTVELMQALCSAVNDASQDASLRVLVITGAGSCFCAGLDLAQSADAASNDKVANRVAETLLTISRCRLVTMAVVRGAAVAGGAGLMSACDFVIAEESTRIGYPEVRRGLVAGLVMTFLRRQLGERHIRELLLGSELITARRAYEIGLVNRALPESEMESERNAIIDSICDGAPRAQAKTKELLEELWLSKVDADLKKALAFHLQARTSAEAKEGISAFLGKRLPSWVPKS